MGVLGTFIKHRLKRLDVTSTYAYYVGIGAIFVSLIVTLVTFFKLWLGEGTNFWLSLLISVIIFYVFTELYSFIVLLGLKLFEEAENKL
jgi:hypothetical protein